MGGLLLWIRDSQLIGLSLSIGLSFVRSFAEHGASICVREYGTAILTDILLLVAHYNLLLLLLFDSLHVLLKLLLIANGLPILVA